jgi:hypothetical protein
MLKGRDHLVAAAALGEKLTVTVKKVEIIVGEVVCVEVQSLQPTRKLF